MSDFYLTHMAETVGDGVSFVSMVVISNYFLINSLRLDDTHMLQWTESG